LNPKTGNDRQSTVLRQVAGLETLSMEQLREQWRTLFGSEPPAYSSSFIKKRLAYRLQEIAFGGLSEEAKEKMKTILEENGYDELGGKRVKKSSIKSNLPIIGTRLIREWNDKRYEVTVVKEGFEFAGRKYRSLTAITKAITGTHWNGPAFFGLRSSGKSKSQEAR
jgi:hypothetical protein